MTQILLTIAQVFGLTFIILLPTAFIVGLWQTTSIKEALKYVKASLVMSFILLLQLIIIYAIGYAIFYVLDLPYI